MCFKMSKCFYVFAFGFSFFWHHLLLVFFFWIDLLWLCLSHTNCILFSIHASSYSFGSCAVSTSRLQLTFETGHTSRLTDFGLFEGLFTSVLTWTQFPHSLTDDLPLFSRQFPRFTHLFWEHHSTIGPIVSISPSQSASAVVHCSTQRAAIADRFISPWRLRVGWKWSPKTAGHAVMAGLAMPGSARTKDPFSKLQRCATPHALPYNVGNETN